MLTATIGKEIVLKIKNDIGVLNQVSKIVSEKGVNILAVHGSVEGENGIVRLVTEDNLRAMDALKEHNYAPRECSAVVVDLAHKPGLLRRVTEDLAEEGIDLHHIYATAGQNQDRCLMVFSSSNNDHAVVVLNR